MDFSLKRKSANPGRATATRRSNRLKNAYETTKLDAYISSCQLSDDYPGLLFNWNVDVVQAFIVSANALGAAAPNKPRWLTNDPGNMSVVSFQNDVTANLASFGGGYRCDSAFVAPNTMEQYSSIMLRLKEIEVDPFIQAVMKTGVQGVLADTFVVNDKTTARGKRLSICVPDARYVQVFR